MTSIYQLIEFIPIIYLKLHDSNVQVITMSLHLLCQ